MSDNVATQIDGLGHITHGQDNHFYNGFKAGEWGGDFGLLKADVTTIPPIVARGVLIDVAGYKNVDALPSHYEITVEDLEGTLRTQNIDVVPGSVVLVRTGTARYWGRNGSDHTKIGEHDSAGIGLKAAKWLVEQKGALMIGSDTSGLEYVPPKPEDSQAMGGSFNPVHVYLLVDQGIHILESTTWNNSPPTEPTNSPIFCRPMQFVEQWPERLCVLSLSDERSGAGEASLPATGSEFC
jgi:kynurenine formamidase